MPMRGAEPGKGGETAAQCVEDIASADFVSIRLDTSGSVPGVGDGGRAVDLEPHYQACYEYVKGGTLPLRIGLCCCRWQEASGTWELIPYELDFWPGASLSMSASAASLRLRLADLEIARRRRRHMREKAREKAKDDEKQQGPTGSAGHSSDGSRWSGQLACSTQWAMAAIHRAEVPVVVHDGLLDLLQLYDKFEGDAPENHSDFDRACLDVFPKAFDTCVLARAVPTSLGICQGGLACIDDVLKRVWHVPRGDAAMRFKELGLYTHRASSVRLGLVGGGGLGSAARGAMAVAEVFLLLTAHLARSDDASEALCKQVSPDLASNCGNAEAATKDSLVHASCVEKEAAQDCSVSTDIGSPSRWTSSAGASLFAEEDSSALSSEGDVGSFPFLRRKRPRKDMVEADKGTESCEKRACLHTSPSRASGEGAWPGYRFLEALARGPLTEQVRQRRSGALGPGIRNAGQ
mmetsp:Transcript_96828/g.273649  ORF Transcript_96828/g.273649 Transcript_96828/m.273649 type:complete len:464 (-) Transcript_96828:68-1459(-)